MKEIDPEEFSSPETSEFRAERRDFMQSQARKMGVQPPTAIEIELSAFRDAPFGTLAKMGTCIKTELCMNCFRLQWPPETLALEKDGYQNTFARRMLFALNNYQVVNFMGCASSGKTHLTAAYCYTKWKCSPWNTSVFLSTTNASAGEARTWGALKDLFKADRYPVGKRLDYLHLITLEENDKTGDRDYRDAIAAVLIKPGNEGQNVVSSICGRKNQNVLWDCDEMPFLDPGILQARLNLFSNPFFQFIGKGNAPREGDPLYQDAEPVDPRMPDGWKSIDPNDQSHRWWRTKSGVCLYFDGEKSPNLEAPPEEDPPFPKLITREMIANIAADSGGTDSPGYWTQVRGFPTSGDIQDTVLTMKLLEAHGGTSKPNWLGEELECLAGLDLGFRADGDPCVADFAKLGKEVDGRKILAHESDSVTLVPNVSSGIPFEDQIAHKFLDHARERECHYVCVDISGDGGITAQALVRIARERQWALSVVPVSFMGTADDDVNFVVGGKKKPAKELFDRKVSQLWYSYRLSVQNGVIRGSTRHSKAVKELCQRKVSMDEKKRWMVEPKKEMKKRIKRSPDNGDARVLCHEAARRKGLSQASASENVDSRLKELQWLQQQQRPRGAAYQSGHASRGYVGR